MDSAYVTIMKNSFRLGLILLIGSLASCSTTSTSYVESLSGYSVVRGRITKVDNFTGRVTETLGDGVAVTVTEPGCTISMTFPNEQSKSMDVAPGMMIIYGNADDFVLKSQFDSSATPPSSPPNAPK